MIPDTKTRPSHRVLWAPASHPPPSDGPRPPDAEVLQRRRPSVPEPPLPFPSRREAGFFGTYGPLFYFVLLASIPLLSALLLFSSPPDTPFEPLSDAERASLASPPPVAAPPPTALRVGSDPGDALVYVDGSFEGLTPYATETLAPGWHAITLRKQGYALGDTLIYLEPGVATALSFALDSVAVVAPGAAPPDAPTDTPTDAMIALAPSAEASVEPQAEAPQYGGVLVEASPAGAEVRVDGARAGRSPLRLRDLRPGTHEVTLSFPGYAPQTRHVLVAPGQVATLRAELAPLTGTLSVAVRPWGSIYVDGVLHARDTDLRHEIVVPIGTRVVRAVHPVLGAQEWRVEVEADRSTPVDFDLN